MAVKILQRRPGSRISGLSGPRRLFSGHSSLPELGPHIPYPEPPSKVVSSLSALKGLLSGVSESAASAMQHRRAADDMPLSFFERVNEFIARNAPNIEPGAVMDTLSKAKVPILVTLGVAAAAGLGYLAYRLYKHFTAKSAQETITTIMEDFRSVAPSIFEVSGWPEQIKADVTAAVNAGPEEMVKRVAEIKATLISKQQKTDPKRGGGGINVFQRLPPFAQMKGTGIMTI